MIDNIKRIFRKEIMALIRDKGIIFLMIGGPLFYSFFYPFPYKDDIVRDVPVAVIDRDQTYNSRLLTRMLDATEELVVVREYTDADAAYKAFTERKIYGIIYIEKDFQKNILKNKPEKVKVYTDGSYLVYYKQVTGASLRAVKSMSAGVEIKKLQSKGAGKAAYTMRSPVNLITKNLYNHVGGYTEYVVPAVFIAIIQQIMIIGIGMRAGTLREYRKKYKKGITPLHVLLGKVLAFSVIGLFYFVYLFIIMYKFWGFTGGRDVAGFFVFYIPFMLSVILLGITLSYLFKDREGSMMFIIVTSLPILFMSGIIWPAYLMPWFIKVLRLVFPMTYGVEGVVHLFIMDAPFRSAADAFLSLWGLVFIYGLLAYKVVKKRFPYRI
ncbi:ABC-2 type transport system permease protein [Parelusimicrobium proximum]|uniref:ABC transporter permease n=1 Tax=Parelusimicrobium proximum TaxID=3228953 RepID=UPI003D16A82A